MSKYNDCAIYLGNIVKYENQRKVIVNPNNKSNRKVYLAYNSATDTFYPIQSRAFSCLYSLTLEREKLSDEEIEEYKKIFNEANYPYTCQGKEGEVFIDEDSLEEIFVKKEEKSK